MAVMNLPAFSVAHLLKDSAGRGMHDETVQYLRNRGMFLDTCLRQLAILPRAGHNNSLAIAKLDWTTNEFAYDFLLQTATGLNSAIPGESNVLGQFKRAWEHWIASANDKQIAQLGPIANQLQRDSADIRRKFLQGIGGRSYGSLVRKILLTNASDRVLIVGAGDLAQSIWPYFKNFELALWNRNTPAINLPSSIQVYQPSESAAAATWASQIIFTTPADTSNDKLWLDLLLADENPRTIAHLGCRRECRRVWQSPPSQLSFFDLDDLFDLRKQQTKVRSLRISQARNACSQRSRNFIFSEGSNELVKRQSKLFARRA